MEKTTPETAMKEMTLLLMYLSAFSDRMLPGSKIAWKGYDFDIINELDDEDYINQGSRRAKSVSLTEKGMQSAQDLLIKYNIADWK